MQNNQTVSETVRKLKLLKEDLEAIIKLKNSAFEVFSCDFKFKDVNSLFNISWAWIQLCSWNNSHDTTPYLAIKDLSEIYSDFYDLTVATIDERELRDALEESRKNIEICIKKIEIEIDEENKQLDELYNKFVENTHEFKFLFQEEQIKQLIMDKLLKL